VASIIRKALNGGGGGSGGDESHGRRHGRRGKAVQDEPMEPMLKAPGTMRLKLKYDELPAKFCFQIQFASLHRGGAAQRGGRGG
jgi:hypothetical protein